MHLQHITQVQLPIKDIRNSEVGTHVVACMNSRLTFLAKLNITCVADAFNLPIRRVVVFVAALWAK